ncbi:MAG: hypothetical protein B0W54_01030 [Cellvibrio sp. 79]|nr:MAG: hypothetical protein B0W54_01030 [Cellvibrio sp. 79]
MQEYFLLFRRDATYQLKTNSVKVINEHTAEFNDDLLLHGVTVPINLKIHFKGGAKNILTGFYRLGFNTTSSFNRSAFGVNDLVAAIADQVDVEVFAEFQQR